MSTKQVEKGARKRVVLHHATGPLAGLHQILGVVEGKHAEVSAEDYPTSIRYRANGTRSAHHERTRTRYISYREWAQVVTGKLNEFNPAQV